MEEHEITDRKLYKRVKRVLKATRGQYWLVLFGGILFTIVGAFLTVGLLCSLNSAIVPAQIIMFSILGIASLAFGIPLTIYALKRIIPYFRDLYVLKHGQISTARIAGSNSITIQGHYAWRKSNFYSFDIRFYDENGEKRYKTLHYYNQTQYKYIQKIRTVKIKHLDGRAVIIEDVPEKQ